MNLAKFLGKQKSMFSQKPEVTYADSAFDLWLACHGQAEIAERLGVSLGETNIFINGKDAVLEKTPTAAYTGEAWHPYNVWKKQDK